MVIRDFTKFVKEYYEDTTNLVGVEVGVYKGDNALSIKEYLNPRLLILVDVWCDECPGTDKGNINRLHDTISKFADDISVIIMRSPSTMAATLFNDEQFDFIYIDANHGAADEDIQYWYPLLKPGGVFGGHDYNQVGEIVNNAFPKMSVSHTDMGRVQGLDWWVIKE
jgi:hypothetical protein